jgi:hypothetical protein
MKPGTEKEAVSGEKSGGESVSGEKSGGEGEPSSERES